MGCNINSIISLIENVLMLREGKFIEQDEKKQFLISNDLQIIIKLKENFGLAFV
jgi:hypothetical protein